ncbi:carbohydrate sulfotransferase 14 [Lethenteron reissneri]|uniref:carbohydrate sulfotransferase 14 n=1 Tax=Lethenteron reissneri TaxID=7753 RepID=UPI002AB7C39D|nr:carbohydrate sulfotransferase 14 [Lethenteron reissneri]
MAGRRALAPSVFTFALVAASALLLVVLERQWLSRATKEGAPSPVERPGELGGPEGDVGPEADALAEVAWRARNASIAAGCARDALPRSLSSLPPGARSLLLRHVLVNDEYRFLYCYVPKVACSNWKRVIKVLSGAMDSLNQAGKMDHKRDLLFLSDFTAEEIDYRLKHYFKFMFVRDPLERLLSAYRNKLGETVEYQRRIGSQILRKYRPNWQGGPADDVTFTEFANFIVDTLETSDPWRVDEHWAPATSLCQPCIMGYDRVGSYNSLHADARAVLAMVGAPRGFSFPQRQSWYRPVTPQLHAYFLSTLPQGMLGELMDRYKLDYLLFGFEMTDGLALATAARETEEDVVERWN